MKINMYTQKLGDLNSTGEMGVVTNVVPAVRFKSLYRGTLKILNGRKCCDNSRHLRFNRKTLQAAENSSSL